MANILVVIELRAGAPLPACLEALGQARRVGTELGATVYAVLPLAQPPTYAEGDLLSLLAQRGADKIVLITDESIGTARTMRWNSHGAALASACEQLPPTVLVFAATLGAREIAPRLAARMGAALVPDGWLETHDGSIAVGPGAGRLTAALDPTTALPAVVTLPAGRYLEAEGDEEAEVEIMTASGTSEQFEPLTEIPDEPARPSVQIVAPGPPASGSEPLGKAALALAAALDDSVVTEPSDCINLLVWVGDDASRSDEALVVETRASLCSGAAPDANYHVRGDAAALATALVGELAGGAGKAGEA